jgi:hypothetical protein
MPHPGLPAFNRRYATHNDMGHIENRGLKHTDTVAPSLRDTKQYGTHRKPWVETHGYRRIVATRRTTPLLRDGQQYGAIRCETASDLPPTQSGPAFVRWGQSARY